MSRELWVKEGDRNSRFFHLSTIIRKQRNCISEIQNYFLEKFSSFFSSSLPLFPENLENLIEPCVTDQENLELCKIPTREEIKKVVFGMKSLKAPGPNGFPALFYKHY